jgi:hypothetical protein
MREEMTKLFFLQLRQTVARSRVLQLFFARNSTDPGGWKTTQCDSPLLCTGGEGGDRADGRWEEGEKNSPFQPLTLVFPMQRFLKKNYISHLLVLLLLLTF